jgi:hypothetical protein
MKTFELKKCTIILIILLLTLLLTNCSSPSEPKNEASIIDPIVGNLYPYNEDIHVLVEGNNIDHIFVHTSKDPDMRFDGEKPFELYVNVDDYSGDWLTFFVDVVYTDEESETLSVTVYIDGY